MRACDWPEVDLDHLRKSYPDTPNRVLADRFGRSVRAVSAQAVRLGLSKDADFLRAQPRGRRPPAKVGDETVWDGYRIRKVSDTGRRGDWVAVHVQLWEEHHGPVPDGYVVMFKDGDRTNVEIGNLECISRAEQLERYTVMNLPAQLREVVWLKGALTRKINAHDH